LAEVGKAALSYCYRNEDGSIVAHSFFDVSGTDPADILGDDLFVTPDAVDQHQGLQEDVGQRRGGQYLDPAAVRRQLETSGAVSDDRYVRTVSAISGHGHHHHHQHSSSSGGDFASLSPAMVRRVRSQGDPAEVDFEEWFPASRSNSSGSGSSSMGHRGSSSSTSSGGGNGGN
jgi:hypothetical protein